MRLPDFIIGGAPRSGTTWLYHLLERHPRIQMAKPVKPEPKFFLIDELYEKGIEYYSATWFSGIGAGKVAGEKSTNYMESPEAAARIARHLPGVRLVFILRDPVARAYSNYLWTRMNGLEAEGFSRALELEAERSAAYPEKLRFARPYDYFSRGLYARHLGAYFNLMPRESILCLRFEDIATDAGALAARLHRFLAVEERPADAEGLGAINAAEGSSSPPDAADEARLRLMYQGPNRELYALLGAEFTHWKD